MSPRKISASIGRLSAAIDRYRGWLTNKLGPRGTLVAENIAVYSIAAAITWYVSRGISFDKFVAGLRTANLWLFVGANLASVAIWFCGEMYLYSKLFGFFHKPTTFRETLLPTAAQYFIQLINSFVAVGALVVFLNRRKRVPWITAGSTMMFLAIVDGIGMALVTVLAGILVPTSPIREGLPYAIAALMFFGAVLAWFKLGHPRSSIGRWLHERRELHAFRAAKLHHYVVLIGIRIAIIIPQGFLFYVASLSFHLRIPLSEMLAFTPVLLIASGQPFTPSGLGTLQLAFVAGFSRFAPKEDLIAMALGINVIHILTRIPLGLSAAGSFAHSVLMIHGKGRVIQSSRHRSGTRLASRARAGRPESSRS